MTEISKLMACERKQGQASLFFTNVNKPYTCGELNPTKCITLYS